MRKRRFSRRDRSSCCTSRRAARRPFGLIEPLEPSRSAFEHRLRVEPLEERRMLTAILVDSLDDVVAADGHITLREALEAANTNTAVHDAPAGSSTETDVITFDESLFTDGTNPVPGTIALGGTQLEITDTTAGVEICGPGADLLSIGANNLSRVFYLGEEAEAVLSNLTITGGTSPYGGGGVFSDNAHVTVFDSIVTGNTSNGSNTGGGGIHGSGPESVLDIIGSTIVGNYSTDDGGGIYSSGLVFITDSTIESNTADDGSAIYGAGSASTITVEQSIISSNSGGNVVTNWEGALSIIRSSILDNAANPLYTYGDTEIIESVISGNAGQIIVSKGTTTIDASTITGNETGISSSTYTELVITDSAVSNSSCVSSNSYGINNGGLCTITNSTISGNTGSGIRNSGYGVLHLIGSTVTGNVANTGGGIYNKATAYIVSSTIAGNQANSDGGGIHNEGTLEIVNSLIVGNSASDGGGIDDEGTLIVMQSTIAGNTAGRNGAGIFGRGASSPATLNNCIVALNGTFADMEMVDTAVDGGANLIAVDPQFVDYKSYEEMGPGDDGTWGTADDVLGDFRLSEYSPAIDMGADGDVPVGLSTDLDGNARIAGTLVDLGAYEFQGTLPATRETASTTVTALDDVVDLYDGSISLREALLYAGQGTLGDTVSFDASLDGGTIVLAGQSLPIAGGLNINASSLSSLTIDADEQSRVFTVISVEEAQLVGLSIVGGLAGVGGGIANNGMLAIVDSTIIGNATNSGDGAGIHSHGTFNSLSIAGSVISGNSSEGRGGGIDLRDGSVSIVDSVILDNSGSSGGGIYSTFGDVEVSNSTISANTATDDYGGGIYGYNNTILLSDVVLSDNTSVWGGGGIYSADYGTVTIANSTLSGNRVGSDGGAVYCRSTLNISGSTIADNMADDEGGGIYCGHAVSITNSTFPGNHAKDGGGIYVSSYGNVTLVDSIVTENTATVDGGGIYTSDRGDVVITNSTISGNVAVNGNGGGLNDSANSQVVLVNSVVASNSAKQGGGINMPVGDLTAANSIIAGNHAGDSSPDLAVRDNALVAGSDHNLIGIWEGTASPGAHSLWGTSEAPLDPKMTAIANEDGTVLYYRPHHDSPVPNAGNNELAVDPDGAPLTTDALGNARIVGGTVDMGAVELAATPELALTMTPTVEMLEGESVSVTIMLTAQPASAVAVTIAKRDSDSESVVSDQVLVQFDNTNWDVPQTVVLSAIHDLDIENETAVFSFSSDNMDTVRVWVSATDDDDRVFVVDSLADTVADDGVVTLREAIEAANTNLPVYDAPNGSVNYPDRITFAPELAGETIVLAGSQLEILEDLVIEGLGADELTIDANGLSRVFYVDSDVSVTLDGLTISGGRVQYVTDDWLSNNGAGILNLGSLVLTESIVAGNVAEGSTSYGGGIFNQGTLEVTFSSVTNNVTPDTNYYGSGGGISSFGDMTLTDSGISGNASATGGGIYVAGDGTATIERCTITDNTATSGAGIEGHNDSLNVIDSIISGNLSVESGGAIQVGSSSAVLVADSTLRGNSAGTMGGAIYSFADLTIDGCTITGNHSGDQGGGVYAKDRRLTVLNTLIAQNQSGTDGGGVYSELSTTTITNSSLVHNAAVDGGGLFGGTTGSRVLTVTNSIVALNAAAEFGQDVSLNSLTIGPESDYNLIGTWEESGTPGANSLWGSLESPLDPQLITITDENGDILHCRPHPDSPVVDAGSNALAVDGDGNPLLMDLLGNPRIVGGAVDIGAVELSDSPELAVTHTPHVHLLEGTGVPVEVALTAEPEGTVVVSFGQYVEGGGNVATVLLFDAMNWNVPQTVTIWAEHDDDMLNDDSASFFFSSENMETIYVSVSVIDDDFQTYVVDSLADVVAADGQLTLREALEAANTNADVGDAPAGSGNWSDVILFAPELEGQTINLTHGQLAISDQVIIEGLGTESLTIDGGGQSRLFYIAPDVEATISHLTLSGGAAVNGGAVSNSLGSTVKISHAILSGNVATNRGGAVQNLGTMLLDHVTLVGNSAVSHGGGAYNSTDCALIVVDSNVFDNSAQEGAGLYNLGRLEMSDSIVAGNSASVYGGGTLNAGEMTVVGSTFTENTAVSRGAGIYNLGELDVTSSTFMANMATNAQAYGGGIACYDGATATVVDSTFLANSAGFGGALFGYTNTVVEVTGSTIEGNSAVTWGGAVFGYTNATTTLLETTLTDNSAGDKGGAVFIAGGSALSVTDSTITGNATGIRGGGIHVENSPAAIVNSVVVGNTAGENGGGVFADTSDLTLTNADVVANVAGSVGGGIHASGGSLTLANSIIALNEATSSENLFGTVAAGSEAYLLDTDPGFVRAPCHGGDGWGDDPSTTEIDESLNDDYGDLRLTSTSPAVNAGVNVLAVDTQGNPLTTDLAGQPRIIYDTVDIGAYEFCVVADANYDGTVDMGDAAILAQGFGTSEAGWADGDFNGDGRVDLLDASILAANWGAEFTPTAEQSPGIPASQFVGPLPVEGRSTARRLIKPARAESSPVEQAEASAHDAALAEQYGPAEASTPAREQLVWCEVLARRQTRRRELAAVDLALDADPWMLDR